MGLHAQVNQFGREVNIAVEGKIQHAELAQIAAIVQHFQDQGCSTIRFDLSHALASHGKDAPLPKDLSLALQYPAPGAFPFCDEY